MGKLTDKEKKEQQRQKDMIAEAMGRAIRYYREQQYLPENKRKLISQDKVSERGGLEPNVFQRYDTGKVSPGMVNLLKIAKGLDINPERIVEKAFQFLKENSKFKL